MKVKAAFWISGVSAIIATILRCIQLLFFFNDRTGFVTDSGVFTYLYCGVLLISALVSVILCKNARDTTGVMQRARSFGAAAASFLLALFMFYCAFVLFLCRILLLDMSTSFLHPSPSYAIVRLGDVG